MERFKELIEARIAAWCGALPKSELYSPMVYLLQLPAKRIRPIATLMACELFGGKAEDALDEALGIELFHNFSLMHDDIMDGSPLRRGLPTVHENWNVNTAILSGDALLVKSYALMGCKPDVLTLFGRYALEVCEGQQMDMEFERRDEVSLEEYNEMIRLKTAVLLSCALQVGAMVAGASDADQQHIGRFGEQLGLAFQLRDDLLDAFGDPKETGKQRGGDLRAGKKTWLLLSGLEIERGQGGVMLSAELAKPKDDRDAMVMVWALERNGMYERGNAEVADREQRALAELNAVEVSAERKAPLQALTEALMGRRS